jgi:PAS domain S-box-containing protein
LISESPFSSSQTTMDAERFRLLVQSVNDYAIYMLSPEGIVISWNSGAQRFKGYVADEIIGEHFSRFYRPEDRERGLPITALQTARERGKFEDEGWRVRKDGTYFWASVVIDPVYDQDANLVGFAKVTRDITERKEAADALHASEEQFRLLVQGVTDYAIYMLSSDGIVTNWNAGARRIKGYEADEVIGSHFSRFYTHEDQQTGLPTTALSKAAELGAFESEGWRVRKDGTQFWAHVVIDSIRDDAGNLIGFAKVTRDVTERRKASDDLQKSQAALFQAQKMESIGLLTGGIAHDFNNLLNVMSNSVALLRYSLTDAKELRLLDGIDKAAARGMLLIQQLLSFAKQQTFKLEKRNVNRIIKSFESMLRRANNNFLRFTLELADDLPPVEIDVAQLESAILNLVINACDATPLGGIICLATEVVCLAEQNNEKIAPGTYVKISVTDTGHGIPADIIDRIIEPFFTTKPQGKGTGLGLSQVYGFAQQAKGGLHISSGAGKTCVAILLPALMETIADVPYEASCEKALIVDDQPDVLEIAAEVFKTLGYEVVCVSSAREALEILEHSSDISVLFADVMMPGMNGIELGHKAKALIPSLKVLLASGFTAPVLKERYSELEIFDLISKPYKLPEIAKKLRNS